MMTITLDPNDNTVTMSDDLAMEFKRRLPKFILRLFKLNRFRPLLLFRMNDRYGMMPVGRKYYKWAECCYTMYNPHTKTYGFVSLNPTVQCMVYNLDLPFEEETLLQVTKERVGNKEIYLFGDGRL